MNLNSQDILCVIESCKQNNRESQQQLYRLLYGYAYSITYRYANDDQEANTLVNDSFLKLFRNIGVFKNGDSTDVFNSFKSWFRKIILNTCIDHYRSNKKIKTELVIDKVSSFTDTHENGEEKMRYKEIISTVKQLSTAYRTVFNLHVVEGFSHEEIAGLLGISVGTSKSNLSKAKENLRTLLQNKMNYIIS